LMLSIFLPPPEKYNSMIPNKKKRADAFFIRYSR